MKKKMAKPLQSISALASAQVSPQVVVGILVVFSLALSVSLAAFAFRIFSANLSPGPT